MQPRKLIAATSATMIIAFAVALMPFYLHFDFDPKKPREILFPDVRVMQAHANPAAVSGSMNFITACAAEAGLTPAQFVATTVGMTTIASGYDITKGAGVSMANTVGESIDNLIDAADYPAYDTLSSVEQESWGSKANYDAAKYNSLLNAFGMGEEKSTFFGSGGGNLENPAEYDGWSQVGRDRLAQIGRIGNLWASGARAIFGDIKAAFSDVSEVETWIGSDEIRVNGEGVANWPSSWPTDIPVGISSAVQYRVNNSLRDIVLFSNDVYLITAKYADRITVKAGSKNAFQYGFSRFSSLSYSGRIATVGGDSFYYIDIETDGSAVTANNINVPIITVSANTSENQTKAMLHAVLFGKLGGNIPTIEGYPQQQIPDDEKIYFPTDGVTPNITYQTFITPTRTQNIYNPENQTSTDDWRDETESNVLPLMNIQFDKLFPFCMLFDIQKLFDKVSSVSGSSGTQESYMTISIPLDVPGFSQGETLDLNLQWLHDLLVTVRPFVQILLAAGLLFVTIRFWQGVLTG